MLFGREKEVRSLVLNLRKRANTLVFGAQGVGKSSVLMEAAGRLALEGAEAVYVNDCRSRRSLLEEAMRARHLSNESIRKMSVRDLRNALLNSGKKEPFCLILDHLPKLHHPLQHLLEIMEDCFVLAFGVTGLPASYDLYYWKFKALEIKELSREPSMHWISMELRNMGYPEVLRKSIAAEIFRLTGGNPGSISRTLSVIKRQPTLIDDPICVGRMFLDGKISRLA
jgi:AAA+ ATPase superfamily predicted ATPase